MAKYEVMGKNTDLGTGKRLEVGEVIKDDRDLVKMFPGKFRLLKTGAKKVQEQTEEPEELEDVTPDNKKFGKVIDGGPTQPLPPDGSLDQNAANSGVRDERVPAKAGKANQTGPAGRGKDEGDDEEATETTPKAGKPAPAKGRRKKAEDAAEEEEYSDVTADFPDAKKGDLVVFEYAGGEFQVFDADDKDNLEAKPVNDGPLRTSKSVNAFLKKYHA